MNREKDWKVLFIDDDEGIRKVISIALEDVGYNMLTAADGQKGIELCQKHSPQIIITDIRMPGMDGIEVLKSIKKTDPDKEVIVTTGFGEIEYAIQALQLDASDFITKPINDSALQVALERAKQRYNTRKELKDYTALIEERWMSTAEELAKLINFQEKLIESSIDGIAGCDKDGKIIVFNKSMEQMLGYDSQKAIGKKFISQLFEKGKWEALEEKIYSEEHGGKNRLLLYETYLISKAKIEIPVQLSAAALVRENKEIGVVAFFRDLRKIRRLEQEFADQARLLHQDKMISLGKLSASVVHEINNPLTGVLNYIRLMIKILGRDSFSAEQIQKFNKYLGLMESEVGHCSDIVSSLLAFARKSELEFGEVNIKDLLQKCLILSDHKLTLQNIQINTVLYSEIPKVTGDFNQLQQCILNLIFNAADAMPEGGLLTIESSFHPESRLVKIMVADTGCGIAPKDLPKIFDPFFSTKEEGKGLGLGLSVAYGIIARHKGVIEAKSEPGKGTVLTITLPVNAKGA
ncbi:MAG: response regulator [Desulfobacterales bacterium]|uniref:histidine kinase n=1 Tax=Candidatus Desulfatibia vada TaxID=2841696 RepID=A0A8J6P655_9BACT|nr:response regulator [Candidatus Desulfatibia vada]